MKAFKRLRIVALSALVWLFNSCGDPLEDFRVHISPDYYQSIMTVYLFDMADNSQLLEGANMSISGPNADKVFTTGGNRNYDISNGAISLLFTSEAFNENSEVSFEMLIEKPGYEPIVQSVTVFASQEVLEKRVYLLSKSNLPSNTAISSSNFSLNSAGELQNELVVELNAPSSTLESSKISLPEGTRFLDNQGFQLTGTEIDVEVLYLGSNSEQALQYTNGRSGLFTVQTDSEVLNLPQTGVQLLDVNMSIGGVPVKSFENGQMFLEFTLSPEALLYPDRRPMEIGDSLLLVSSDKYDVVWQGHDWSTAYSDGALLKVSGFSEHLSKFTFASGERDIGIPVFKFSQENGMEIELSNIDIKIRPQGSDDWTSVGTENPYKGIYGYTADDFNNTPVYYNQSYTRKYVSIGSMIKTLMIKPSMDYEVQITANHSGGIIEDWTLTQIESRIVQVGDGFGSFVIPSVLFLLTTPDLPEPLKATYTITCESDPNTVLYAPKGWKLFLKDSPSPWPDYINETPIYTIPDFGSNQFEGYGLTSGQTYTLFVYNPEAPLFPVWSTTLQVNEGQNHEIVLTDGQCTALKEHLPGQE